jgi:hypothetical protein
MDAKNDSLPELTDIAAAMEAVDGKTPTTVLEAFLPKVATHLGKRLVPLTAGHELALAQLGHPLATGTKWEDVDVLMALFVFSRPSREVFAMIAGGTFEDDFFGFIDSIPSADIPKLGNDMVAHWMRSRATALAMESPTPGTQKKKRRFWMVAQFCLVGLRNLRMVAGRGYPRHSACPNLRIERLPRMGAGA